MMFIKLTIKYNENIKKTYVTIRKILNIIYYMY